MSMFGRILGLGILLTEFTVGAETNKCRVQLETVPEGAVVTVDDVDRGTTPLLLFNLKPGLHRVKFRLDGYEERNVVVRSGGEPVTTCCETLDEVKGLLLLRSEPSGADISINGASIGTTPRLVTHLSAKDRYTVKLAKTGYLDQVVKVEFEGRKPLVLDEKLMLASGRINITSEPTGAAVTVNGVPRGRTPVKVDQVPRGRAVVKFQLEGYEEEVRELSINAGDEQNLPIVLRARPGTLRITSVPSGARFYLNDKPLGKGEQVISSLSAGTYTVRGELEGYGTTSQEVTLENGGSASVELRMTSVMGSIEVKTLPPGVQIFLDGKLVGVTKGESEVLASNVLTINNVMEGEHQLIARKDGHSERMRRAKVKSGKPSRYNLKLPRIFIPDVEVFTAGESYRGLLIRNGAEGVTIEVKPGVTQSIPRDKVRKVVFLDKKASKSKQ